MTGDPDLELLVAWRGGDADAGKRLFDRYFERLYRFFCTKVGQDVDDLVQETLLACLHSQSTFREESSFRTYLFAIARHRLLKYRERWLRGGQHEDFDRVRVQALDASPNTLLCRHDEQVALLRALRRIPLDLQVLIELHYWEELSSAELSEILEVPAPTIRSRLRRAKQHVRDALAELADRPGLATEDDFDRWLRSMHAARPERAP